MKNKILPLLVTLVIMPATLFCQVHNQNPQLRKGALVIGNGNYLSSVLANPENDARSIDTVLTRLGFTVFKYENLNQSQMKKAIDDFGLALKGYDVGLFFYAGHGIQYNGYNYLIPVDATLNTERQVEYDCVQADRILALMEGAGTKINIIILDACRNNPFERSWTRTSTGRGLAFMNAPSGTIIAYSTSPGNTAQDGSGNNSPYTSAILESIQIPNIAITQMFQNVSKIVALKSDKQQIPWYSSSLDGDFFINMTDVSQSQNPVIGDIKEIIKYGRIELSSEISGEVYLDGKKLIRIGSNTILPIQNLSYGSHTIEIIGEENWSEKFEINSDQPLMLNAKTKNAGLRNIATDTTIFIDERDGEKYKIIKIGTQIWMAENLRVTKFSDNKAIKLVSDPREWRRTESAAYCWYDNDKDYHMGTYGALYNWHAVSSGKLCPAGWHIPSDSEINIMISFIGIQNSGGKLKESGFNHWAPPNLGANNVTGFSAVPSGYRDHNGDYKSLSLSCSYWSSYSMYEGWAFSFTLNYDKSAVESSGQTNIKSGFSVRCIKD